MIGSRHFRLGVALALACSLGVESASAADGSVAVPSSTAPRSVSSKISEAVAAKLPKYAAPESPKRVDAAGPTGPGAGPDDIVTLEKITVRPLTKESRTEASWLTEKGRVDLAMKTYPGLRIGNFFGLNRGLALAMMEEERLARERTVLTDRVERATANDGADAKKLRALIKAAAQRPNTDWQTSRAGGR